MLRGIRGELLQAAEAFPNGVRESRYRAFNLRLDRVDDPGFIEQRMGGHTRRWKPPTWA